MSLVHEKWLACPEPVLPKTGMAFELDIKMDDFSEESLESLDNDSRNEFIVKHWIDHAHKYGKTLVFALNRSHAKRLTETFRELAPRMTVDYIVSGEGNLSDRKTKVSLFRNGKIDILINCKIFTEGFDCPDVKTVFLTRPTLSVSLYLQMIGRGTRTTPTKTSFYLVDFQDNLGKYQNQLVMPWVLGDELKIDDETQQNGIKPENIDRLSRLKEEIPSCIKEDLTLSPVDLNLISGYVIYNHETGRENGFLIHTQDEDSFLDWWRELNYQKETLSAEDMGELALSLYKGLSAKRLSLQGFVSAAIALVNGNAKYVKLNSSETLDTIFEFLRDVSITSEDEGDINRHLENIYAVIKYTVDEIDDTLTWCQIYENEKHLFDKALKAITDNKQLRGLSLKNKISEIYNAYLIDTHLMEFEWERFCLNVIKNNFPCIIYMP
jgi:hypothetical protein